MKKLIHDGREIEDNAVDYHDGTVMIKYKDNDDIAIVNKSEITAVEDKS